jgi:hypothetical protein
LFDLFSSEFMDRWIYGHMLLPSERAHLSNGKVVLRASRIFLVWRNRPGPLKSRGNNKSTPKPGLGCQAQIEFDVVTLCGTRDRCVRLDSEYLPNGHVGLQSFTLLAFVHNDSHCHIPQLPVNRRIIEVLLSAIYVSMEFHAKRDAHLRLVHFLGIARG